jgi:hypothetical protein
VAGTRYVLLGRLGRGDGCDMFLARRDARLTELAVLKVVRALSDADLVSREYEVLEALRHACPRCDVVDRFWPARTALDSPARGRPTGMPLLAGQNRRSGTSPVVQARSISLLAGQNRLARPQSAHCG